MLRSSNPQLSAIAQDGVHIFFEEIENRLVLNRLGHGLHLENGFKSLQEIIYSNPTLHEILGKLGYKKPICLLSVYIPKHPHGFGSEVRPHQESTFAHTQPLSSCVLWIAIDDALIDNACMYGLPRSHQLPLKFISHVDHAKKRRDYVQIHDVEIPDFDLKENLYRPLEVRAGDAILFHGNYVHCSPKNTSARSRRALSFQFIETDGVEFSRFNWIQEPNTRWLYE
jgi:phytanoyl-CoA hydroxylase